MLSHFFRVSAGFMIILPLKTFDYSNSSKGRRNFFFLKRLTILKMFIIIVFLHILTHHNIFLMDFPSYTRCQQPVIEKGESG